MAKKRCICGDSSILPLCDGSHRASGWKCGEQRVENVPFAFVGATSLVNLADRLAHRFAGVSLNSVSGDFHCEQLVLLADGHSMDSLKTMSKRITTSRTKVIGIGVPDSVLGWAFPEAEVVSISDEAPLWKSVEDAVLARDHSQSFTSKPSVFLSHSVADEGILFPIVDSLRSHFGIEVFVCADSIPAGAEWRNEIMANLERCDLFVFVVSKESRLSVFCGFEVGAATALNKRVGILSLDDQGPPAYIQDIQTLSANRLQTRKPWLTSEECLLEAFLEILFRT